MDRMVNLVKVSYRILAPILLVNVDDKNCWRVDGGDSKGGAGG